MRSPAILLLAVMLAVATLLPMGSARAQEAPPVDSALAIPPIVWQLNAFPGISVGIEPGRYTVQFVPDGTVNIRADCNWVMGVWSGGDGTLDITATQTTVAACPEDSLEEPFVQALDEATNYSIDAAMTLVISGPVGGMTFTPALAPMA